jgi:hypothetical protein
MTSRAEECAGAMSYVRAVARRFGTGHVQGPGDPRVGRVPAWERESWLEALAVVRDLYGRMPYRGDIEDDPFTRYEEGA